MTLPTRAARTSTPRPPRPRPAPAPRSAPIDERTLWAFFTGMLAIFVLASICAGTVASVYAYRQTHPAEAGEGIPSGSTEPQPPATALPSGGDNPAPTATAALPEAEPLPPLPTGTIYLLLLGIDARPDQLNDPTRSDSMMVLRVDFDKHSARLLSFPRDLWLAMPPQVQEQGVEVGRINQGYYYGELYDLPGGGPQTAIDTVRLNFGIPVQGYALVNFQGFVQIVDALGGIDIDVPEAIHDPAFPTDDYGTIVLDIPAGSQHMDGITALRYARTRHQDSDVQRTQRQQLVLLAIRDKAASLDVVKAVPGIWNAMAGNFSASLSPEQFLTYGLAAQQIPRESITTYSVDQTMLLPWTTPGGANVWIPIRDRLAPLIAAFMQD